MDLFLIYMKCVLGSKNISFFLGFCHEGKILLLSAHHLVLDVPLLLDAIMPKYFEIGMLLFYIYRRKKGLPWGGESVNCVYRRSSSSFHVLKLDVPSILSSKWMDIEAIASSSCSMLQDLQRLRLSSEIVSLSTFPNILTRTHSIIFFYVYVLTPKSILGLKIIKDSIGMIVLVCGSMIWFLYWSKVLYFSGNLPPSNRHKEYLKCWSGWSHT